MNKDDDDNDDDDDELTSQNLKQKQVIAGKWGIVTRSKSWLDLIGWKLYLLSDWLKHIAQVISTNSRAQQTQNKNKHTKTKLVLFTCIYRLISLRCRQTQPR